MDNKCIFCNDLDNENIVIENDLCVFLQQDQKVLIGSGLIIPKAHRETVFDLTEDEITATFKLLKEVKKHIDDTLNPDGYNVGWNCGKIGGQEIFHAHFHVIPRFEDEPYAGRGIRSWLKSDENMRE